MIVVQHTVITAEDGGLKSIFDLANVHADIFQVITEGEGILTLREFVSSWEERNYEKHLTRWIDRNVPSCKVGVLRAPDSSWHGKRVSIAYRTTITSPKTEVLLVPRRKIGRTNCRLEKKKSWKMRSTICTILFWTTQSSHVILSQIVSGENSDVGKCRSPLPAK